MNVGISKKVLASIFIFFSVVFCFMEKHVTTELLLTWLN